MADTTAAKARLTAYAMGIAERAGQLMARALDEAVPRAAEHNAEHGQRLADLQRVSFRPLGFTIEYPSQQTRWGEADVGIYTDRGTQPHIIRARFATVLVFPWPAGPPQLAGSDGLYRFPQVNHPGSTMHVGWWSTRTDEQAFSEALSIARSQVGY